MKCKKRYVYKALFYDNAGNWTYDFIACTDEEALLQVRQYENIPSHKKVGLTFVAFLGDLEEYKPNI